MKFLRFPDVNGYYTPGYNYPIYQNITDSYILVMDFNPGMINLESLNLNSLPAQLVTIVKIIDNNGTSVGKVIESSLTVALAPGTITVWNGTSMESEPAQIPIVDRSDRQFFPKYIPPRYSLAFDLIGPSSSTQVPIGMAGWGFIFEETDEVKT